MTIELNDAALSQARELVREGEVVRDQRDAWSEAEPSAEEENAFIDREGWTAYAHWHLGVDRDENPQTKRAYSFPYGDFHKVHRSGVVSAESRAGQYHHAEIETALKKLRELIDSEGEAERAG